MTAEAKKMPVAFLGHGSPMNALAKNAYSKALQAWGKQIAKPKCILMVSAHWMTRGQFVTGQSQPKTIHDFYGFPKELFEVQYPAPGQPTLAQKIVDDFPDLKIHMDTTEWGFDHGTWSVLIHAFPNADVPIIQTSLDMTKAPVYHYEFGKKLSKLRSEGVLILGSGNIVHNLSQIEWNPKAKTYDWAIEFDQWVANKLQKNEFLEILQEGPSAPGYKQSVPTFEHYLPMLTILGAAEREEKVNLIFEEMQNASISMRSFQIG